MQRRNFLKNTLAASAALAIPGTAMASVDNWAKLDTKPFTGTYIPATREYYINNALYFINNLLKEVNEDNMLPNGSFKIEYEFKNGCITSLYNIKSYNWKCFDNQMRLLCNGRKYIEGLEFEKSYIQEELKDYDNLKCIYLSFPIYSPFFWNDINSLDYTYQYHEEDKNHLDDIMEHYNIYYNKPSSSYSYILVDNVNESLKYIKSPVSYFKNEKENHLLIKNADDNTYIAIRRSSFSFKEHFDILTKHLQRIHDYKQELLHIYQKKYITLETAIDCAFNHQIGYSEHEIKQSFMGLNPLDANKIYHFYGKTT